MIRTNNTPKLTIDATKATVHSNLVCSGFSASNATVAGAATIDSLSVSSINMPMSGLATHFEVDNTARVSFGQLSTIHGDVSISGSISVSGSGGCDLTPYQHHANSHLQAVGCEPKVDNNNVNLHATSIANWNTFLNWGNFTHACNNHALAPGATTDANTHFIDFAVPVGAKSCLVHLLA